MKAAAIISGYNTIDAWMRGTDVKQRATPIILVRLSGRASHTVHIISKDDRKGIMWVVCVFTPRNL
jgi:hypothetical protein